MGRILFQYPAWASSLFLNNIEVVCLCQEKPLKRSDFGIFYLKYLVSLRHYFALQFIRRYYEAIHV